MQYPQPLQMSCCTTTVPNSVRNSAPVVQTSRQAACVQCLHTSELISQRMSPRSSRPGCLPGSPDEGMPRNSGPAAIGAAASGCGLGSTPGTVPVSVAVLAARTAAAGAPEAPVGAAAKGGDCRPA